jgi:hypothetical protein
MKAITALFILGGVLFSSESALADRFGLTPGAWEFEVEYDLIGIPQTFPRYSVKQCMNEANPFPNIARSGDECQMQMQGHFGRTYTWMVNCSTSWEMVQGMGRIHYFRDRARGDIHMQIINPHNPPQSMIYRIKGRYLGECEE